MSSKRLLSESNILEIFYLDDKESAIFWGTENCIGKAEASLEDIFCSSRNDDDVIPIVLKCMKDYTIKLYFSAIKSVPTSKCTILTRFLILLESYETSDEEISELIQQYLRCCITCSCNFTTSLRSSLLKTLSARSLLPTVDVLSMKGGIFLLIEWLKHLKQSRKAVSKALVGRQISKASSVYLLAILLFLYYHRIVFGSSRQQKWNSSCTL